MSDPTDPKPVTPTNKPTKAPRWVTRWRYEISAKPILPGVWALKAGGFLARARVTDPRTGKRHQVMRVVGGEDPGAVYQGLKVEVERLQAQLADPSPNGIARTKTPALLPTFGDYADALLARKLRARKIKSEVGRVKWENTLKLHIKPAFGLYRVDQLRHADILKWHDKVSERITTGLPQKLSPLTANSWLSILRVICASMTAEHELDRNPCDKVPSFDESLHRTFTHEEPNALTGDELRAFIAAMGRLFPQHVAMTALGFATGLRPSSLRPLRRSGETPDLLLDEGVLLVRRSQTKGDIVMDGTKTKRDQKIGLPSELVALLRWHADTLPEGPMAESELLFPSLTGRFRSRSVLEKPFAAVCKEIGLNKHLSPKGMRRTFQDLARAAAVADVVTRSISGHATEAMQRRYSTVAEVEQREALGRVVDLAGVRKAMQDAKAKRAEDESGSERSSDRQNAPTTADTSEGVKAGCESPEGMKKAR